MRGSAKAITDDISIYDLSTLREAAHLSQKYIANKLNIDVSTCRRWEKSGDTRILKVIIENIQNCECSNTSHLRAALHALNQIKSPSKLYKDYPTARERKSISVIKSQPRFPAVGLRDLYEYLRQRESQLDNEARFDELQEVKRALVYLVTNHSSE